MIKGRDNIQNYLAKKERGRWYYIKERKGQLTVEISQMKVGQPHNSIIQFYFFIFAFSFLV